MECHKECSIFRTQQQRLRAIADQNQFNEWHPILGEIGNEMDFQKEYWRRMEHDGMPVYFHKNEPDWFVPNKTGDEVLQRLNRHTHNIGDLDTIRFLNRLPGSKPLDYQGRSTYLKLKHLRELWLHLTNRCNLSCSHCLFSSSPKDKLELTSDTIFEISKDAYRLGCRVFVLTGGEPFVHPEIENIIKGLLKLTHSHVVVLTNAINLPDLLSRHRFDFDRFHLQISVDGVAENHDQLRGQGKFQQLTKNLQWLRKQKIPFTLSMCVTRQNVQDMPEIIEFAASTGASNVHFMWYFIRGRGTKENFAPVEIILKNLQAAWARAETHNIQIDNLESLKTQIFAPRGTIHDGTTAAWESLAVGPDALLYPSAALIGIPDLSSDLSSGLEAAWRQSPVLNEIRSCTASSLNSPFRFLLGGGDIDHSYVHKKTFIGDDPYQPLYENMALWLISKEAGQLPKRQSPQIRLRMGEVLESCGAHGKVALVHSNCLLATAQEDSLTIVKSYYADAAGDNKTEILNPVCYDDRLMDHIPEEYRFRGYGCGSPVMDADVQEGQHVLDLGCGSGVECFLAARLTGPTGRVTGIDMLDPMLELASKGVEGVSKNLGFNNIQFKKGYLEYLPVRNDSVDVAISNCVMNLSVHKRRAYNEIFRVLRPGGHLVISDVVCETEPDPAIRNDETLRGECIAGAMTQNHLMALLEETGFKGIRLIKRFPYRTVKGHPFFSLTYSAVKPEESEKVRVIYRGPMSILVTNSGILLPQGVDLSIPRHEAEWFGDQVFILDEAGAVTNLEAENTCGCFVSPEENDRKPGKERPDSFQKLSRLSLGCMVCGKPITYLSEEQECRCAYCRKLFSANALCENGHYVCDACHAEDGLKVIQHICLNTTETDMIRLLGQIRRHPAIPMHGPEHHAIVPGIILAAYRNAGGEISDSIIENGVKRGSFVAGGYCAFMGVCGAAVGVGIAFSLILDANPLMPDRRKLVQRSTQAALAEISKLKAARCCQRDSWLALKKAASLSKTYLPVTLKSENDLICKQKRQNKECMGQECPLY
jgi:MoaA/NifB/PqqE/SkfB family radical SAM enzyme/SAM-dependent methyltransferase